MTEQNVVAEETLDPADWEAMRALGHRMLDDMLDYVRTVRQRPAWQHAPDEVKAHFGESLPLAPQPLEEVYDEFLEYVLPYGLGCVINILVVRRKGSRWSEAKGLPVAAGLIVGEALVSVLASMVKVFGGPS